MNGTAVGRAAYTLYDEDTVEITSLFVAKDLRGQGVGMELLRRLEASARMAGYRYGNVALSMKMEQAFKVFHRLGYKEIPSYGVYHNKPDIVFLSHKL